MPLLTWCAIGLIAGCLARWLTGASRQTLVVDMVVGVAGAVVGGLIARSVGVDGVTGFNLWSSLIAGGGAVLILAALRVVHLGRWS